MEATYLTAFTTGLLGGFGHCIGMCGPIVASYSFFHSRTIYYKLLTHIFYNTGRISSYTFIGASAGLVGSVINSAGRIAGIQNIIAFIAGLCMIFIGLSVTGIFSNIKWLESHSGRFIKLSRELITESSVWKYFPLGAIFGLMPCGLSYSVFISAAGTGNLFSGMMIAFLFGIGTFPAMILFGFTASYLSNVLRGVLYKIAGIIIICMGLVYLLRATGINA